MARKGDERPVAQKEQRAREIATMICEPPVPAAFQKSVGKNTAAELQIQVKAKEILHGLLRDYTNRRSLERVLNFQALVAVKSLVSRRQVKAAKWSPASVVGSRS